MADLPRLVRRRSVISGWGVYAGQTIEEDTHIVQYNINSRWVRDAAIGGNIARYINHACEPNCYVDIVGHTIWIRASRRIRKGEELTYDYNTEGWAKIQCRCTRRCKRVL